LAFWQPFWNPDNVHQNHGVFEAAASIAMGVWGYLHGPQAMRIRENNPQDYLRASAPINIYSMRIVREKKI
jgi:hypothetical protein